LFLNGGVLERCHEVKAWYIFLPLKGNHEIELRLPLLLPIEIADLDALDGNEDPFPSRADYHERLRLAPDSGIWH
jgi:hypothetical protein